MDDTSSAYIAARFNYPLPGEMVLGDGTTSGPGDVFVNRPLHSGQLYRVFVTAYTSPSVSATTSIMSLQHVAKYCGFENKLVF